MLASGTLWTVYDYLTHNNGEVLDYLKNGGPYPVIDVHGHHAYCLSRNFGAATFGGYTIGGKTIDANDVSKFQNMETVRYAVPATNRAGPYAFTFSIQQSINLEVWLNNVKQTTGFKVTAAPGGLANGGSVTFTTIPDAGAILLLRAGLSQNAQITQCPEHVAAAFKVANALRVAAGKSAVPGFVYVHDEFRPRHHDRSFHRDAATDRWHEHIHTRPAVRPLRHGRMGEKLYHFDFAGQALRARADPPDAPRISLAPDHPRPAVVRRRASLHLHLDGEQGGDRPNGLRLRRRHLQAGRQERELESEQRRLPHKSGCGG